MPLFRGVGGSGESSTSAYAAEVAEEALTATTKASEAAASATSALAAQTAAEAAQTAAETAQTAAETAQTAAENAQESIDGLYLGALASNPTVDSNGDAVTVGDWYFNTTSNETRIYDGSTWNSINPDLSGDASPQLGGNLDLNSNDITGTGNVNITGNVVLTGTVDGRDIATDGTKLDGIEALADVTDTANVTAAGALMDSEVTNLAQVKSFDSSDYATAAQGTTADSAMQDLIDDTTPQLGGNLDVNGNSIVSVSNGDITLAPNGTGNVILDGLTYPSADGTNGQVLTTDGAGALSFADVASGFDPDVDSFNIGNDAVSSGTNSVALGHDTDATGTGSVALGMSAQATATGATALGYLADATATYAISIGDSDAQAIYSIAIGGNAQANTAATYGVAIGYNAKAQAANAIHINSSSSQTNRPTVAGNLVIETDDARLQYKSSTWSFFGGAVDISGALYADNAVYIENSSGYGVIEIGGSTGAYIDLKSPFSDDFDGRIITTGTGVEIMSGTGGGVKLQHQGANTKFETTGSGVTVTGDLKFGTSGDGIDFSTTSDASGMSSELLDDYEEGTFTPVFRGTTTTGVLTYSSQNGSYTKIGRLVHCCINIVASGVTTAPAGNLRVGGLPFTANSAINGGGATITYAANFGNTNHPDGATVAPNTDSIILRNRQSADARDDILTATSTSGIGTAIQMTLNATYYV